MTYTDKEIQLIVTQNEKLQALKKDNKQKFLDQHIPIPKAVRRMRTKQC